jgi:hypothetical protein
VVAAPFDPVRPLYRTLLAYAVVSILIFSAGLAEFVYFEPLGQHSGIQARIVGVYRYDPDTKTTVGPDSNSFPRTQQFAAVVDWSSLPPDVVAGAQWNDSFGNVVAGVGPATPLHLQHQTIIAVPITPPFHHILPGHYTFVVERYENGVPVEVIGRRIVRVER